VVQRLLALASCFVRKSAGMCYGLAKTIQRQNLRLNGRAKFAGLIFLLSLPLLDMVKGAFAQEGALLCHRPLKPQPMGIQDAKAARGTI
jgi:hypothetical protein